MPPELIIALAAVGAHYCLELHQGVKLFHIARAIALEQVRLRESLMEPIDAFPDPGGFFPTPPSASTGYYERPQFNTSDLGQPPIDSKEDYATIGTMQALFFLMAMATWAGAYRPLVRHAISTQSVLAMMIRQHGLHETPSDASTWEDWARVESSRRTKLIIFSFFNLHRILLNLPSPVMMSDVNLRLPCTEKLWKAPSARSWSSVVQDSEQPLLFQECFTMLFKPSEPAPACSSLGSHIMIHALLQHIFSIQQATRLGSLTDGLGSELSTSLGQALKKWQKVWELNSESSLNPLDKHGPITFNSTALFHLAYIRLAADIGPARSLLEQTHTQIAAKLMDQPDLQRGPMLTLAARHAKSTIKTAALCPPVQMGVYFVGRAPSWSVMHAVCSMDYAYILNQFLKAITAKDLEYPLGADEKLVLNVLKETLREVESSSPHGNPEVIDSTPHLLGPKAVRAWAIILQGMRTWNAVDLITKTLFTYVDLLERCACQY
ncbi:hypothetical protein N7449_002957 [Penicillium cf. viridicatum]|uniref:Xylanolytic transcriptional activator regulatory domain-containing protein n=1 Tax=Penicillium cf. viridicatum TaxID=2972119 RepID=A0A9W9T3Z4_9EURO|nr:hypothetical protein N7449_002957 [Penicillium cf. viridicatum]